MTLKLVNQSVAYSVGVVEDVFVKVGKFHILVDFVVVDYDVDPRVPLILGRPFLRTAQALIDDNFKEVLKIKKIAHDLSGSTTSIPDSYPSLTPVETSDSLLEDFVDELALLDLFLPGGNFVTFSNPLFDANDDFTSSDDELLPEEDELEDIESNNSYVSNLDEPVLFVTPLFDANADECFEPGGDIDKINAFLDMGVSTDIEVGYHDSEGDKIFLEYSLKKIASMDYYLLFSSGSEDIIFDPGIFVFSFYSLELVLSHQSGTFVCFNVFLNILNESLIEIYSSTCFIPNITMIWRESS
ncbi:putative reverse transcriptase domain-containing protein [Tanacetum coccineum]